MAECQKTSLTPNKSDKENTGDPSEIKNESEERHLTYNASSSKKAGKHNREEKRVDDHADNNKKKTSQDSQERNAENAWTKQENNNQNKKKHNQWNNGEQGSNQTKPDLLEYAYGDSGQDSDQSDVAKAEQVTRNLTHLKDTFSYSDALKRDLREDPHGQMVRKSTEVQ